MVETSKEPAERLAAIGINPDKIKGILGKEENRDKPNPKLNKFMEVLDFCGATYDCSKEKGALLEGVAMRTKPVHAPYLKTMTMFVVNDKWLKAAQLDEAIKWIEAMVKKHGQGYELDEEELEKATGVGIVVT